MKKKNFILTFALALALGAGATVYADSTSVSPTTTNTIPQGYGFGRITGQRGYEFMADLLRDKFGISDSDIAAAKNSGKTLYDLAKEKGVTDEQFKSAMVEERTKTIDEAIQNGSVTKEQGDALKARIIDNSANCTLGQGPAQGKVNGFGRGRGMGQNCSNFNIANTSN
ncbi:hypothetical protein N4T77_18565 [Clostridium sp. CX1]|uniref:hypothetical protein n=1 Tax=Clostridium sp. CX1 TaxID=2978346 RepID=UPI0021C0AAFA|nr:hypothetical protein [Clostridium sp. CX1]MCT8978597.1 hypothetical protein [Clostridium sp. CX1]